MRLFTAFLLALVLNLSAYAQQLVLPGDYPDPSVVKIGDTYWASATTSNWFPAYPILKSKDLVNWTTVSYVFPDKMPEWADYYFWAPEFTYENGKVYIYYSAHKRNGNLCVGIASADRPEGPYTDHGPIICQEVGSIDAFPMRDKNGKLFMIWKEDANSVGKPTPIWIQELNEARTALVGEKKELFRNEAPWEANLVEGVSMMRHGDYYYAFYAGAGCCGTGCSYAGGIARAKDLLGPWEKYNKNPVLIPGGDWICPGHGTPIEKDGKYYFMYHAYDKNTNVFTGRQGLIMEFRFTPDGWVEFVPGRISADVVAQPVSDDFRGRTLSMDWQRTVFQNATLSMNGGELQLNALPGIGAFMGQKTLKGDYTATTSIRTKRSSAAAGISAIGDEKNIITAFLDNGIVTVMQVKDGKETELFRKPVAAKSKTWLRMQVTGGRHIRFLWSRNGKDFSPVHDQPIDAAYLPPWDRAVRAGVVSKGVSGTIAVFDRFDLTY